jgi:hypothetical protein
MNFREWIKGRSPAELIWQAGLILGSLGFLAYVIVLAWLGWYTRYMADDFCNAVMFSRDPLGGLILRYMEGWGGNRYSNIWLVGLSELLFSRHVNYLPVIHLFAWLAGLVWLWIEIRRRVGALWPASMTAYMGLSIAFFSLLQVTNLYQTVFWRSSMTTHFAPIVYGTLLAAYLLRLFNQNGRTLRIRSKFAAALSAFLVGGFSEPADALQITLLLLFILGVYAWVEKPARKKILSLLGWTLIGSLLSLLVMFLSPSNFRRLGDPPGLVQLVRDTIQYAYIFISSSFAVLPLPSLLSVILPALLFWIHGRMTAVAHARERRRSMWVVMAVAPLIMYILVMASFSPSVYGQGYPVERVRFYARLIMTVWLMLEGALLGWSLAGISAGPSNRLAVLAGSVLFTAIVVVYPFRAAVQAALKIPEYSERAALWDARDDYVRRLAESGERDLVVPGFSGVYGVKELDDYETHWVNLCAAEYYGVNSIRTVSVPDEYLWEFFSGQ